MGFGTGSLACSSSAAARPSPEQLGRPREIHERGSAARADAAVDPHAESQALVGERERLRVAAHTGLSGIAGENRIVEEVPPELDALKGEQVVGWERERRETLRIQGHGIRVGVRPVRTRAVAAASGDDEPRQDDRGEREPPAHPRE